MEPLVVRTLWHIKCGQRKAVVALFVSKVAMGKHTSNNALLPQSVFMAHRSELGFYAVHKVRT